jgi:hypothetical protein
MSLMCKVLDIAISIQHVDVWSVSLGGSPRVIIINHSVIYYENKIWQHFMLCCTDLVPASLPAQFVPFLLPMKLLQTLLPCWLQYLKIWTFMMVTISSWGKPISTSCVTTYLHIY